MKYQKQLDKIDRREYSRAELARIRVNAEERLMGGDLDAKLVIDAIDHASPVDDFVVFMGFCPDASLANRLDIEWRRNGTCTFIFLDSLQQVARFNSIRPGDLVILKKRQDFGRTMQLFGHGRVTGIDHDASGNRFLLMTWAEQDAVIEVPLLGRNSTVDIRSIAQVDAEMPDYLYTWLNVPRPPASRGSNLTIG
jgi:hypothetical protein